MPFVVECRNCGSKNRIRVDRSGAKCGKCGAPLPEPGTGRPMEINDGDLDELIAGSDRPVLVDFWASWCGPCKMMAPVLDSLAASQSKVRVAKLNTERNTVQPQRYGIRSIPTLVLFEGGKEVRRIAGAMPLDALKRELAAWL